ncbi:MAG TPA: DUF6364 family protein [Thermoguttaceae bacterium]|nr:DUF6364 family protein [Thermoguttaceae bacterium]
MKNMTLSADEELIARARAYAQAHNTTLNQLIRDFLARIAGQPDGEEAAREFAALARSQAGCSSADWAFDRREIHRRKGPS